MRCFTLRPGLPGSGGHAGIGVPDHRLCQRPADGEVPPSGPPLLPKRVRRDPVVPEKSPVPDAGIPIRSIEVGLEDVGLRLLTVIEPIAVGVTEDLRFALPRAPSDPFRSGLDQAKSEPSSANTPTAPRSVACPSPWSRRISNTSSGVRISSLPTPSPGVETEVQASPVIPPPRPQPGGVAQF